MDSPRLSLPEVLVTLQRVHHDPLQTSTALFLAMLISEILSGAAYGGDSRRFYVSTPHHRELLQRLHDLGFQDATVHSSCLIVRWVDEEDVAPGTFAEDMRRLYLAQDDAPPRTREGLRLIADVVWLALNERSTGARNFWDRRLNLETDARLAEELIARNGFSVQRDHARLRLQVPRP